MVVVYSGCHYCGGRQIKLPTIRCHLAFAIQIQDGKYFYVRSTHVKKETSRINFYATVEIANVRFFYARFTYVNIYAKVEIHL